MHISTNIHENRKATPLGEYTWKYAAGECMVTGLEGLILRNTFNGLVVVISTVITLLSENERQTDPQYYGEFSSKIYLTVMSLWLDFSGIRCGILSVTDVPVLITWS